MSPTVAGGAENQSDAASSLFNLDAFNFGANGGMASPQTGTEESQNGFGFSFSFGDAPQSNAGNANENENGESGGFSLFNFGAGNPDGTSESSDAGNFLGGFSFNF